MTGDRCRPVEVDTEDGPMVIPVHGGEPMTARGRDAFGEVVRAAKEALGKQADQTEGGDPEAAIYEAARDFARRIDRIAVAAGYPHLPDTHFEALMYDAARRARAYMRNSAKDDGS